MLGLYGNDGKAGTSMIGYLEFKVQGLGFEVEVLSHTRYQAPCQELWEFGMQRSCRAASCTHPCFSWMLAKGRLHKTPPALVLGVSHFLGGSLNIWLSWWEV